MSARGELTTQPALTDTEVDTICERGRSGLNEIAKARGGDPWEILWLLARDVRSLRADIASAKDVIRGQVDETERARKGERG